MKNFHLILIISVLLLPACSAAASNSLQTPVAQIQVQSTSQPLATAQPSVADTSTSTPIPLITGTPTSASSVTVTPTPTVDPSQPAGLDVLSHQGYSMNDGFYIFGQMLNNTATPMGNINITATYYYQSAGRPVVVGTKVGTTLLDVIPAYGTTPFVIGPFIALTNTHSGPVTWYDLHEEGQTASTLSRQDLVVQTGANSYSAGSWLYVRGEILNTGKTDAKFVKVVITLYDSNGNIIGALSTYTKPSTIPAGGFAPFSVSTEYWPNFDHFNVQIQAQ